MSYYEPVRHQPRAPHPLDQAAEHNTRELEDRILARVKTELLASPNGLLTKQYQPYLGQGRTDAGRVPACFAAHDGTNPANAISATPPGLVHNNNGGYLGLGFTTKRLDTDNIFATPTTAPSIFTIHNAGWYQLSAQVNFAANATGSRFLRFGIFPLVGATFTYGEAGQVNGGAGNSVSLVCTPPAMYFNAGDRFQLQAWQNSGGNLNIGNVPGLSPCMSAVKIAN